MVAVDSWKRTHHPNIVSLREAFTTKNFGDSCTWRGGGEGGKKKSENILKKLFFPHIFLALIFSYDYHPQSQTLFQRYFSQASEAPSEQELWSILLQLVSAIKYVHSNGKAWY